MLNRALRFTAAVALATSALVGIAGAPAAHAAADPSPLALAVVGQAGSYFDVTIDAGSSLGLEIARTNPGTSAVMARSYAGSVFTIVNGGFGASGSGEAATGATEWVDYPDEAFSIAADTTDTKGFTVSVPSGTAPGQYISSIVLQTNDAVPGSGQVALDRVVRQAVAISIRVPGALDPKFSLGAASHKTVGGHSAVNVALSNEGNQNLKPAGPMTVKDATKAVVSEALVAMGSVYAGMSTSVAVTLGGLLEPGEYTVSLSLTDPTTGVSASITDVPFTVVAPPVESQSPLTQLPAIVQDAIENPGPVTLLLVLTTLLLLALAALAIVLIRRRVMSKRAAQAAARDLAVTT